MKTMNLNFRNILGATAIASMLFIGASTLTSCGKEGCTDVAANNYDADATDDDATCTYDSDQFVGTYAMSDDCASEPNPINYTLTITQVSSNKANILVDDLSNFGAISAEATVSGSVFTITNYAFSVGANNYTVNATGTLNGSTLSLVYGITLSGTTDNCSGTGIKQ
jgi:hypothetical protein